MKKLLLAVAMAAACFSAHPAGAQGPVVLPQVKNAGGSNVPSQGSVLIGSDGVEKGTPTNPFTMAAAAPLGVTTVPSAGTITTANTFQLVLAADGTRKGCTIQNTSTVTEYVSVEATGIATIPRSFTLAPGAVFSCSSGPIVITDALSATAASSGASYVIGRQ